MADVSTVSAIVSPVFPPIKVIVNSQFDWPTFLLGGAAGSFIGAFIILGIERWWDARTEEAKSVKEKEKISQALNIELQSSIETCNKLIGLISHDPAVTTYARFEHLWLETYRNKYIDFTNQESLNLYIYLYNAKRYEEIIYDLQAHAQAFLASSRALTTFKSTYESMNRNIFQRVQELKVLLEFIQNDRVDNKLPKKV